jgi:hypothetical protein
VPLSPAFMIGGFVLFKSEYLPFFSRTHVPSRISYRPPYHAHARSFFIFFVNECVLYKNASAIQSQIQPLCNTCSLLGES